MQQQMANDKRQDEQCQARSDTAAFSRNLDTKVRKMKDKALAQSGNPRQIKNHFGDICGSLLQKINRAIQQRVRQRDGEKEKEQWKARILECCSPKKKNKTGDPEKHQCQRVAGKQVSLCPSTGGSERPEASDSRDCEEDTSQRAGKRNPSKDMLLLHVNQPCAYEWDENSVRCIVVHKRETDQ